MRIVAAHGVGGARRMLLVLDTGEEALEAIERLAREEGIEGATFSGLGALQACVLAFWDPQTRKYEERRIDEQVEVAALTGNVSIAPSGAGRKVHAHVVLGVRDGSARAGHLVRAVVRPTLEVQLAQTSAPLARHVDEATGLPLLSGVRTGD